MFRINLLAMKAGYVSQIVGDYSSFDGETPLLWESEPMESADAARTAATDRVRSAMQQLLAAS